jgi:hypothetical protein
MIVEIIVVINVECDFSTAGALYVIICLRFDYTKKATGILYAIVDDMNDERSNGNIQYSRPLQSMISIYW